MLSLQLLHVCLDLDSELLIMQHDKHGFILQKDHSIYCQAQHRDSGRRQSHSRVRTEFWEHNHPMGLQGQWTKKGSFMKLVLKILLQKMFCYKECWSTCWCACKRSFQDKLLKIMLMNVLETKIWNYCFFRSSLFYHSENSNHTGKHLSSFLF